MNEFIQANSDGISKKKKNIFRTASSDIRGFLVFDKNHKKIGVVSEIYCNKYDLQPRYIEITPLQKSKNIYCFPFEYSQRHLGGPVFIESSKKNLESFEAYLLENVLLLEGIDLITYNDSLTQAINLTIYQEGRCA